MGKKIISFLICAVLLALPSISFSIDFLPPVAGNQDYSSMVAVIINQLFKLVIWPLATAIIIILFIMAGFAFMTSHGEPAKLEAARKWLMWAIVGVIVILLSFSILITVQGLLNIL